MNGEKLSVAGIIGFMILFFTSCSSNESIEETSDQPNIILIFQDDTGFADFQPIDEDHYTAPNVRRLAEDGYIFYNFYVPQAICSASSAALLTVTYAERNRLFGAYGPW